MLPCALLPCELGTSLRLVLLMQECETPLNTQEQVNKTCKQQVCAPVITPSALGAHSATCWTNVLVNIHSQNVRKVGTTCRKELDLQIFYFIQMWRRDSAAALNAATVQGIHCCAVFKSIDTNEIMSSVYLVVLIIRRRFCSSGKHGFYMSQFFKFNTSRSTLPILILGE